jgi:hypothetical protein
VPLSVLRSWSEHDYTLALAQTLYEADLCGDCGHPMAESAVSLYDVPEPARCMACDAIEAARKKVENNPSVERPAALRFGAVKRAFTEAALKRRMPGTKNRT